MTPTDIEKMFPTAPADMPKISSPTTGKPSFTTLDTYQKAINTQAMAVPSASNPNLGWIGLVLTEPDYLAVNNNIAVVEPANPGLAPVQPNPATAAQIAENVRIHGLNANEYQIFMTTRTQLRNMIINSVEDKYINTLAHAITRYNQVSPLDLLTHLWTTYGQIKEADLSANEERMYADWNPPTPIETLYEQLTEGQAFALRGNEVIDDSQLLRKAYDLIQKTGLFQDDCKAWRNKLDTDSTWPLFQEYFTNADDDRRKNTATTGSEGYSANAIQSQVADHMNAILQQWMQPEDEAAFPEENAPHEVPTETANATLDLDEFKKEMIKIATDAVKTAKNVPTRQTYASQGQDNSGKDVTYCWSHGITRNLAHNSKRCSRKKEGHQESATLDNKMGGSTDRCKPRNTTN